MYNKFYYTFLQYFVKLNLNYCRLNLTHVCYQYYRVTLLYLKKRVIYCGYVYLMFFIPLNKFLLKLINLITAILMIP